MIEIRTYNLKPKKLIFESESEFNEFNHFIDLYQDAQNDLNHLFLIHPNAIDEITTIIELFEKKQGAWFIIILSMDSDSLPQQKRDNIWNISYDISNPANLEIQDKFNKFYEYIKNIDSVENVNKVQELIIKHLDSYYELDTQTEQDIAYIKVWFSMNTDNKNWKTLDRFKNDNKRIKKIEKFLSKM